MVPLPHTFRLTNIFPRLTPPPPALLRTFLRQCILFSEQVAWFELNLHRNSIWKGERSDKNLITFAPFSRSRSDYHFGYANLARTVLYPGFLDKTNFPRILTSRARYLQDPSVPTWSRPWTLPGSPGMYRCWGHPAQVSCANLSPGAR